MYFIPLIDTERIAFRHREGDINSYEKESDNDLPCVGTVARRTWRPFTRIRRAKRVGRQVLRATVLLTEDSPVAASSNAMLCKKTIRAQLRGVSDNKSLRQDFALWSLLGSVRFIGVLVWTTTTMATTFCHHKNSHGHYLHGTYRRHGSHAR